MKAVVKATGSMIASEAEARKWQDWSDPDFFLVGRGGETRFLPLFLRQIIPKHHRQQTRLTLTGWFLIIVSMGIGSAAYNTSSNILFMTLSLMLSSLVLSGILSLINFRKLEWKLSVPAHLRVGEVGVAEILVANRKRLFPTMSIAFTVLTSAEKKGERLYLPHSLEAGASTQLESSFIPQVRGICTLSLSGVESKFPFGFLRKTMGSRVAKEVLVWPKRIPYEFEQASGGRRFLSGGSRKNPGVGSDLLNVRPYQAGDTPRLIHWKASARLGKLMIRQLAQEGESGYHIVMDTDASVWDLHSFEMLCSLAGSLAEDLFHAGKLETVRIDDGEAVAVRVMRDLYDFFDRLAELERGAAFKQYRGSVRESHCITFRPEGDHSGGVAIYIDEKKAGKTQS